MLWWFLCIINVLCSLKISQSQKRVLVLAVLHAQPRGGERYNYTHLLINHPFHAWFTTVNNESHTRIKLYYLVCYAPDFNLTIPDRLFQSSGCFRCPCMAGPVNVLINHTSPCMDVARSCMKEISFGLLNVLLVMRPGLLMTANCYRTCAIVSRLAIWLHTRTTPSFS